MSLSLDEVRSYLISLLPPGADKLYDLEPGGDFYKLFDAVAELFKNRGFDLLDILRREIIPGTAVEKLPDWENFLGIANSAAAISGNTAMRQAGVKAKLREFGPFSDSTVGSVIAPLLGYFPTTPLEIMKCSRAALTALHTYTNGNLFTVNNGNALTDASLFINDGGTISKGGARLLLSYTSSGSDPFTVTLTAPSGETRSWTIDSSSDYLFGEEFYGASPWGNWYLNIDNTSGAQIQLNWSVFVEGIGPNQDTGGAIFHWGVYADAAHINENGGADFAAVLKALARIEHSHSVGNLIFGKVPYPDVSAHTIHNAIPDECVPV